MSAASYRQVLFWALGCGFLALFFYAFASILTPFVAGLAIAYLLDPLADRLERMGVSRVIATVFIVGLFVILMIAALLLLVPLAVRETTAFLARLPDIAQRLQTLIAEQGLPRLERLGIDTTKLRTNDDGSIVNLMRQGSAWLGTILQSIWSGGQALFGIASILFITPVVAFFFLLDWNKMIDTVDAVLPRPSRERIRLIAIDIDRAIAGFIRGQALVCLILGLSYAVALTLVGLNFGFLIGLTSGLVGFIPFVGSFGGLVVSLAVAIAQFWPDWGMVAVVGGIFIAGQFLEGNFLQPKLVGSAVGVHPVWIMFALLAFGSLGGFLGLLIAVPAAAAIAVLVRHGLAAYRESSYYTGEIAAAPIVEPAEPASTQALAASVPDAQPPGVEPGRK